MIETASSIIAAAGFAQGRSVVRHAVTCVMAFTAAAAALPSVRADTQSIIAERVMKLTRESSWKLVASVPIGFVTHHPQGLVKIGQTLYVSSVEVKVPTKRFSQPIDGYDRDTGDGVGHLFKIDMAGSLIADLRLGEHTIYHPGGIDYDGKFIWVPVAEYRPNSRSIIYRVDPEKMTATEVFRFADHIGAIVHNTDDDTLHGVSWGSRRFYRWTLGHDRKVSNATTPPEKHGHLMQRTPVVEIDEVDPAKTEGGRRRCLAQFGHSAAQHAGAHDILAVLVIQIVRRVQRAELLWRCGGVGHLSIMAQCPSVEAPRAPAHAV